MRLISRPLAVALVLVALPVVAFPAVAKTKGKSQKAHVHGSAKLGLAVDGNKAQLDLEAPAESIFGFETTAKTDAEKKAQADATAKLNDHGAALFGFNALGCKASSTSVNTKAEEKHEHGHGHDEDQAHADVKASYTFTCDAPLAGKKLALGIMKAFPRIKSLELSLLSGSKQTGKTLKQDETLEL